MKTAQKSTDLKNGKITSFPARALRALGLLLADGAPTVGRGKTFSTVCQPFFFFYENGRNSETKSRKSIRPSCRGPKSEVLGPKKHPLLGRNHVVATTGQSSAKKKVPLSISL